MKVTCPQCRTVYRLPDEKAKPGAKLRCSVCRHVFSLPEETPPVLAEEALSLGPADKNGGELRMTGVSSSPADGERLPEEKQKLEMPEASVRGVLDDEDFQDSLQFAPQSDNGTLDELQEKKRSPLDGAFTLLLVVSLILGGIWAWRHTSYLDGVKAFIKPYLSAEQTPPAEPAALLEKLEIRDWRQYQVKNEKLGAIIVIEGKIKNNFSAPRELIRLEAQLFDAQGKVLASRQQLAGASLSAFQLQLLDKEELEKALNSKLDIIASNIDVLPGGEVPFMVVFTEIPAGASDFTVRIIEASVPKLNGNLSS